MYRRSEYLYPNSSFTKWSIHQIMVQDVYRIGVHPCAEAVLFLKSYIASSSLRTSGHDAQRIPFFYPPVGCCRVDAVLCSRLQSSGHIVGVAYRLRSLTSNKPKSSPVWLQSRLRSENLAYGSLITGNCWPSRFALVTFRRAGRTLPFAWGFLWA